MESTSKVVEQDLAQFAIEAHGGLERWNRFNTVSAHLIQGGVFWGAKGKGGALGDVTVKSIFVARGFRTGPSALRIEGPASNPSGSRSRTRTVRSLKNSFNPGRRSRGTLLRPLGPICSSHTSWDARCGPT